MKTSHTILVVLLAAGGTFAGCDQNKSGPVEPTAEAPSSAQAEKTADESPTPPPRAPLYATGGPAEPVKVGEASAVELSISPTEGFKINKLFDWNFEFHPTGAVAFESKTITSEAVELEDSGATIPVKVTANEAGDHEVTATGNFSVCNDSKCELYRDQEVTFRLSATDG